MNHEPIKRFSKFFFEEVNRLDKKGISPTDITLSTRNLFFTNNNNPEALPFVMSLVNPEIKDLLEKRGRMKTITMRATGITSNDYDKIFNETAFNSYPQIVTKYVKAAAETLSLDNNK